MLSYRWTAPSGITLTSLRDVRSRFPATTAGTYTFTLTVDDGTASNTDEVVITVTEAEPLPGPASGGDLTVDLPGGATMEFMWIEPGTFLMGSPSSEPGREDIEGPQHEVTISQGFYLGKYEITQGQWESVMASNPSDYRGANRPVELVSWEDVQAFISKLSQSEGLDAYRLPTEAEWEYACRAGTATRWSFGDDESKLGEYAWYRDNNNLSGTMDVGLKLPNAWGLYDMHGNVYEWCQDWHGSYTSENQIDPTGPSTGLLRAVRSGTFLNYVRHVRSACRSYFEPVNRYNYVGARLLRMAVAVPLNQPDTSLSAFEEREVELPDGTLTKMVSIGYWLWVDVEEVTVAQWKAAGMSLRTSQEDDEAPVIRVFQGQAENFCRWAGKRLPTPDEWEVAARATKLFDSEYAWHVYPPDAITVWGGNTNTRGFRCVSDY